MDIYELLVNKKKNNLIFLSGGEIDESKINEKFQNLIKKKEVKKLLKKKLKK